MGMTDGLIKQHVSAKHWACQSLVCAGMPVFMRDVGLMFLAPLLVGLWQLNAGSCCTSGGNNLLWSCGQVAS